MNPETCHFQCSDPASCISQLPLFALDPWGAAQVVAVFDRPTPGILRAMLGPLVLGDALNFVDDSLQCLAVAEDGGCATMVLLPGVDTQDMASVWQRVNHALEQASSMAQVAHVDAPVTPKDCFSAWANSTTWVARSGHGDPLGPSVRAIAKLMELLLRQTPSSGAEDPVQLEQHALAAVNQQVAAAVTFVLSALRLDLYEIVTSRPRMRIPMACHLLSLARLHSPAATTYALQALRTESFGVLEMVTSGQPEEVALQIREAVFSGKSLPDALEKLGVAKATHRRSLINPRRSNAAALHDGAALSELAISGRDWLFAMRLATPLPLHDTLDWEVFGRLIQRLRALNFINPATTSWLLQWCARPSWKASVSRLDSLTAQAHVLMAAAKGLANLEVTFEDAVTLLLDMVDESRETGMWTEVGINIHLDSDNMAQWVMVVSHISGQSVDQLMLDIFEAQPALPNGFMTPEFISIKPLNSTDLAMTHGEACKNCLQVLKTVIDYVASGVAIYGVFLAAGAVGTIALRFDATERQPRLQVQEVTGAGNAMAHFDLCRLAQTLADAWVTEAQISDWATYEARCTAWRRRCATS